VGDEQDLRDLHGVARPTRYDFRLVQGDGSTSIERPRLLLASRSPRRRSLLEEAGVAFEVVSSGIDDADLAPGASAPEHWVASLALLKGEAARRALGGRALGAIILGADTVVDSHGEIVGQPRDRDDAERILRRLMGGGHRVLSGAALVDGATGRRLTLTDSAQVRVGRIDEAELQAYLDSGEWSGKAGAYNLSERLAAGWPIAFEGDPSTIMGLPMRRLLPILSDALAGAWGDEP